MVRPLRYFIQTNLLTSPFAPFVEKPENTNILNAAPRPAQRVSGAFTIVKAARRESLGIIKKREICPEKKNTEIKGVFTKKHIVKIIKEQIFPPLLIIFTVI